MAVHPCLTEPGASNDVTRRDRVRGMFRVFVFWLRLPVLTFLVILEPVVRVILTVLALLGLLTTLFFKLYGVPHFPFALMLGFSVGLSLMLATYHALLRLLGR